MRTINFVEAKARLSELFGEAAAGERFRFCDAEKPVATLPSCVAMDQWPRAVTA